MQRKKKLARKLPVGLSGLFPGTDNDAAENVSPSEDTSFNYSSTEAKEEETETISKD